MATKFYKYLSFTLAGFFILFVLLIIIHKAQLISFTHDEGYTYGHYVHENFMDILSLKDGFTNNHILNSILMKYSEMIFGSSELALRLPNVLAAVIYLFYCCFLFYKKMPVLSLLFLVIMTSNTYLLDFFGLARGYGLSIAFMLMSFYHLCAYFDLKKNRDIILFNLAAIFAFLSNLTLLYFYIAALISFYVLSYILFKIKEEPSGNNFITKKTNRINFISIVLSSLVLFEPLRRLLKGNILDFGGKNGFIEDTISTLIYGLFYEIEHTITEVAIIKLLVVGLFLFLFVLMLWHIISKNKHFILRFSHFFLAYIILFLLVMFSVTQHAILESDFFTGRFALFLYPLFMLNLVFFIHYIFESGLKTEGFSLACIIAGVLFCLVLNNINFKYTIDWKYDAGTKNAMEAMVKSHAKRPTESAELGINWLFEPTTNFYKETWKLDWLKQTTRDGIHKEYDYYFAFNTDSIFNNLKDKTVLFRSSDANSVLMRKN
jgi:hypothetical protein